MKLFLDWSSYKDAGTGDAYADIPKTGGDFAKAVAVCIGSQACEKKNRGVMCPSYRVTEDPVLSTGGRVKLLKAALNQSDADSVWVDDENLINAMDLCVSCKGCKRECENEVDMAQIKAEFLAQRNEKRGIPFRNRLFANLPKMLYKYPFTKSIIKARNRNTLLANLLEVWLGVDRHVCLPEPAEKAFTENTTQVSDNENNEQQELVLFVDTFNTYFNPDVAASAFEVLQKAGYSVELLVSNNRSKRPLCCGRTYFANGMIEQAKHEAKRLLQAVEPHLKAGRKIIGLEPSCILSLRDEFLTYGFKEQAQMLANNVLLFEEFIAREHTAKRWPMAFQAVSDSEVLVHGHCHQKAVGATKSMRKVLKMIQGLSHTQIESSCCGMAGQFGFETEHREISKQMAEQGLFPTLREAPETQVIANGFSCQQQIQLGGFNKPLHIAQLLRASIQPEDPS